MSKRGGGEGEPGNGMIMIADAPDERATSRRQSPCPSLRRWLTPVPAAVWSERLDDPRGIEHDPPPQWLRVSWVSNSGLAHDRSAERPVFARENTHGCCVPPLKMVLKAYPTRYYLQLNPPACVPIFCGEPHFRKKEMKSLSLNDDDRTSPALGLVYCKLPS